MTQPDALRSVLVAGGGIVAWCAAAALKRRAPFLDVTVVAAPPPFDALADRIACTLPSLLGFHGDLGIGEEDGVARTGAGFRLGTLFQGWAKGVPDYVHAYGRYGRPVGPTAFHLHWLRAHRDGMATAFDAFAPAAALGRAGRFAPVPAEPPFGEHEYGLTLDLLRYHRMIRAFALHVGAREIAGDVATAALDENGHIAAAMLADGRRLQADLYVDATGPAARLRGSMDQAREDWSRWLPCDRLLLSERPAAEPPPVLTPVAAHAAGWRWTSGTQSGVAYSSARLADSKAAAMLGDGGGGDGEPIRLSAGARLAPWRGNCLAIGDAAVELEPLEWCNLHLALSAIDRLLAMLPDRDMAAVELADFNRQAFAEAERARDFLAAHYAAARRDEPFWRDAAATEPPASLAHTLAQWTERGRLPFYEEETFARDSWAAVLLGQGLIPRRIEPLVEATSPAPARGAMAALLAEIAAAVPRAPTHAAYLAAQQKRVSR